MWHAPPSRYRCGLSAPCYSTRRSIVSRGGGAPIVSRGGILLPPPLPSTFDPPLLRQVLSIAQSTLTELAATKRLKADGLLTPEELRKNNGYDKRTPQEVAKERASFLLDLVSHSK